MQNIYTTCGYCGCGCGLFLMKNNSRIIGVGPSLGHPVSQGTLCLKGWTSYQYIHSPSRLTRPLVRKDSRLRETTWEEGFASAAAGLKAVKGKFGAEAIGFFGAGRATNEELFLLKYLAETVIGTPHIFLDTLSHSLSYKNLFEGRVHQASVEDIATSDLVVLINSDSKEQHPAFSGRVWIALDNGTKVLSFSARKDPLAKHSENHLQIAPFTEGALLKGLLNLFFTEDTSRWEKIPRVAELKENAKDYTPQRVSQTCGIQEGDLKSAFTLLSSAKSAVFIYPWGSMEASRERALIADLKNLLTINGPAGRLAILYPSCNSRGAHVLAKNGTQGDLRAVKALVLLGEPYGEDRKVILSQRGSLELFISLDLFMSPTAEVADILLPSSSFTEKGGTFTNAEGRVQEIVQAMDPLEGTRPDAEILAGIAAELGAKVPSPEDVRKQVSDIMRATVPRATELGFSPEPVPPLPEADVEYPFVFIQDPVNLRWHTDSRVMHSPVLARELWGGYIEMNLEDMRDLGIREGSAAKFITRAEETIAKVKPTEGLKKGTLFSSFYTLLGPVRVERI